MFLSIRPMAIICVATLHCLPAPAAGGGGNSTRSLTARAFPLTLPGTPIIVGKEFDPKTGRESFISQSPQVKSAADLVALEKGELAAQIAKHGALAGALRDRFNAMQDTEFADVTVFLRYPNRPAALNPETHPLSQVLERQRTIEAVKPLGSIHALLARFAGELRNVAILDSGEFTCRATKRQLDILRFHPFVGQIDNTPEMQLLSTYAFSTLATSAYNPASGVPYVSRGQGVNAATFETGVANTNNGSDGNWYLGDLVSCLNLYPSHIDPAPSTPPWANWQHSHQTFKCLWQTAPFANLFHKNILIQTGPLAGSAAADLSVQPNASFIVNNGIQSLSMSLAMSEELTNKNCPSPQYPWPHPNEITPYSAISSYMISADEWAFRYPYPVLGNPAANWGTDYEVNWQCYNGLSVGNVRHTNLNHYEILQDPNLDLCDPRPSCTQTRNPPARYGGANLRPPLNGSDGTPVYTASSGDREMPYLVAPGMSPDAGGENMVDQGPKCVDGPLTCGTSYSAPTLNGIVACVISSDSRMVNRPHVVWATLLATAENVTDGDWNATIDGKDGAGVVSGASAVTFARNHSEPGPNATAVTNGIVSSSLDYNTPGGAVAQYNILIPNPKPPGKHLRVVLTWTSDPVPPWVNALSDLDLGVSDNQSGYAWWSSSWNGNVEIVDPPAAQLTAGGTYQAGVWLFANRLQRPPDSGISGGTLKYALAWTWVKDHAD